MPEIHETKTNAQASVCHLQATSRLGRAKAWQWSQAGCAMLMKLQDPMIEGETFPLTLTFSRWRSDC